MTYTRVRIHSRSIERCGDPRPRVGRRFRPTVVVARVAIHVDEAPTFLRVLVLVATTVDVRVVSHAIFVEVVRVVAHAVLVEVVVVREELVSVDGDTS